MATETRLLYLVDTDNYGGDYPDEKYLKKDSIKIEGRWATYETTKNIEEAQAYAYHPDKVAEAINASRGWEGPRYVKVVWQDYKLQPGFEP